MYIWGGMAESTILKKEVAEGNFREDLYYRLNVIYLKMPPLRDRRADIPLLVQAFVNHYATVNRKNIPGIDEEALKALQNYRWQGNIRELKNIIERMVVLHTQGNISLQNIPEDIRRESSSIRCAG